MWGGPSPELQGLHFPLELGSSWEALQPLLQQSSAALSRILLLSDFSKVC